MMHFQFEDTRRQHETFHVTGAHAEHESLLCLLVFRADKYTRSTQTQHERCINYICMISKGSYVSQLLDFSN